jgi:hypothetical protein
MKKIQVVDWGFCGKELTALGFVQDQEYRQSYGDFDESELMDLVKKIFDSGLNIMLKHISTSWVLLFVDNKGFTQR